MIDMIFAYPLLYVGCTIMSAVYIIPLFLGFLLSTLLGWVAWGSLRTSRSDVSGVLGPRRAPLFIGLLILAALSGGVFLAYAVLSLCF